MNEQSARGLSVFELLAMSWSLEDEVVHSVISRDGKFACFLLASGKLAIVRTTDAESPDRRTTIDETTGRTSIRPRTIDPMAPIIPELATATHLPVIRCGQQGFAAVRRDGTVCQVTARGQVIERTSTGDGAITALGGDFDGERLVFARGDKISIFEPNRDTSPGFLKLAHPVTCLSVHPDGNKVVAWGEGAASIVDLSREPEILWCGDCKGDVTVMNWNAAATHVACGCSDRALLIIGCVDGSVQRIDRFPDEVRCVEFSETGKALVASGAFRLAGWAASDLPQNDEPGTPLASGKVGFVVIDAIAAHPTKALVAAGYQNGMITVTGVGKPDELVVRNASSEAVTTLSWSADGEHLSVGDKAGGCSIVTFPKQMFKHE
ncbi:MAG: WD40 repeat domain-containing protein [Pseudomonadota bacterium]